MTRALTQTAQYRNWRFDQLSAELTFAVAQVGKPELAEWAAISAKHFGGCLVRRAGNITALVRDLAVGALNFATSAVRATQDDRLLAFLAHSAGGAAKTASEAAKAAVDTASRVHRQLTAAPAEAVPRLLTTVVTSLLVAGGPDADGGAPDLDLMFGIGAHRSILSHSIVMGSALEAGVMSLLALVELVHDRLPVVRDPIWDALHKQAAGLTDALKTGAAVGMAYHLFVDGTLQAAPYHDLPFSAPMSVHESILVANAFAEAKGATQSSGRPAPPQAGPSAKRREVTKANLYTTGKTIARQHGKASLLAHKAYLAVDLVLEQAASCRMSDEHCTLIRRYGVWMQALADGDLDPRTLEQHDFVAVARKEAQAQTPHETAWHAYELARWQAENA
jgi:hypothetical protein